MWNPEYIIIKNLFAHKHSEYRFRNNQCTVIFGKNNTDRGMGNNGAGKTTLLEGIAIALTNESLREVKKENFINRDEEECEIDFTLSNSVLKKNLRIYRKFYRGNKPVKIEIWENDELNAQLTSVNEANKYIFELLGISREDLLRYFIISQDNRYMFFTASDGDKKEIMNRITAADMINPVLEKLALDLKTKEAEYKVISDEVNELSMRKELIEEQAEELVKQDNTEEEVEALKEKIADLKSKAGETESQIKKLKKSKDERDKQLSAIDVPDGTEIRAKIKKLKNEVDKLEETLAEDKKIYKALKAEVDGVISCPKCHHKFIQESELGLTVRDAKALLKEATENVKEGEKNLSIKNQLLKKTKDRAKEAERALELVESIEEDKERLERSIRRLTSDRTECIDKIKRYEKEVEELKKQNKNNKQVLSLRKQAAELSEEIAGKMPDVQRMTEEIEMIRFWQFQMGRSGFTTYLANKSIKIIEGITNSFLSMFDVDLSVVINGFTVLKSGEVREKIDVFVQSDGTDAEIFRAKSGGERGRVNLAGVLGIQHLINLSTNGRGLNLLCFDECFHGIDSEGQENIIKVFERLGVTILMITQNVSDNFNSENKLYVVKENKVAKYVDSLQS